MAGDFVCWPCACVSVLCEHVASVLVFCVPCALMSICLDPTHLVTCSQPTCICGPHMVFSGATWVSSGHGPNMGILYGARLVKLYRSYMG